MNGTFDTSESLTRAASHLRIVTYSDVAVASLVIYEYLITLGDEVRFVWTGRWNIAKVLYFVQRYSVFVDTVVLILINDFRVGLDTRTCHISYTVAGYMYVASIAASEVILSLRVIAVWDGRRWVVYGLRTLFVICFAAVTGVQGKFLSTMRFGTPLLPGIGCYVTGGDSILFAAWLVLMVYDATMMVLMLIPGISHYRSGTMGSLSRVIYRDGVLYYIVLFLLALANVICIVTLPPDLASILASLERAMHTILTSRVVHHIRARVDKRNSTDPSFEVIDLTGNRLPR